MTKIVRKTHQTPKRGLVLCEGETEVKYFKGLISHKEHRRRLGAVDVNIYKPKDHSPNGLVTEAKNKIKEAKKLSIPYDFVWVVFDKDGHMDIAKAFNEINTHKAKPKINHAFSITCFEYFILLHFERTTRQFRKCDDIVSAVKKHLPDYEKAVNTYQLVVDKKGVAIDNCKFVLAHVQNDLERGKPVYELPVYCNVHELVEYLEGLNTP